MPQTRFPRIIGDAGNAETWPFPVATSSLMQVPMVQALLPVDTPVIGTESGREFNRRQLQNGHENIGAIVLECINMAPYAVDIQKLTGLPVYSIYTFINWSQSGLVPRKFQA